MIQRKFLTPAHEAAHKAIERRQEEAEAKQFRDQVARVNQAMHNAPLSQPEAKRPNGVVILSHQVFNIVGTDLVDIMAEERRFKEQRDRRNASHIIKADRLA